MSKKRLLIIIIILIFLTGCSATTQVKHKIVTTINDKIIEEYQLSSPITTYIIRPDLSWDITAKTALCCGY